VQGQEGLCPDKVCLRGESLHDSLTPGGSVTATLTVRTAVTNFTVKMPLSWRRSAMLQRRYSVNQTGNVSAGAGDVMETATVRQENNSVDSD